MQKTTTFKSIRAISLHGKPSDETLDRFGDLACKPIVSVGLSDSFWRQGFKWGVNKSQMLASYRATRFEAPDDSNRFIESKPQSPVKIASGEELTRRQSFLWIERHALDYLTPEVTKIGGIIEHRRIFQNDDDHSVMIVPHSCDTGTGLVRRLTSWRLLATYRGENL